MNLISEDVLVKFLDRGAVDGSPVATAGTAITTLMREYELTDEVGNMIDTSGFGGSKKFRPGKDFFRFTIGLLISYTNGPITAVVKHYASIDTTFGPLAEIVGTVGVIRSNTRVVNDDQESIQRIVVEGPADIT